MVATRVLHTQLNCGHKLHHKKPLAIGKPIWCVECREWVDTQAPAEVVAGQTYHPEYDCTTEPIRGKRGYYLTKCQKESCTWSKEAKYRATMDGMHSHQMNAHSRWGNPMLEGF